MLAIAAGLLTAIPALAQLQPVAVKSGVGPGFLKRLTLDSFGYTASPLELGYEFRWSHNSSYYNLHNLDCPLCIVGPPAGSRTRPVLEPFGASIKSNYWNERLIFHASYGGIDGVPGENAAWLNPVLVLARPVNDNWFATSDAGGQVYVDANKTISVGVSQGRITGYGPGESRGSKTTGAVTLSPDLFHQLGRYFKRSGSSSQ